MPYWSRTKVTSVKLAYIYLVLVLLLVTSANAQTALVLNVRKRAEVDVPKDNFHLYLMAGQSSMARSAPVEAILLFERQKSCMLKR